MLTLPRQDQDPYEVEEHPIKALVPDMRPYLRGPSLSSLDSSSQHCLLTLL